MIHQKYGGQVGKNISHYPAVRDPVRRDKILEKLGEGGMSSLIKKSNKLIPQTGGIVFKAFDTKLEREVALKLLRPKAMGDPAAKERFIREARAARALNHHNITTIIDIFLYKYGRQLNE